jgi:hypothetical protein
MERLEIPIVTGTVVKHAVTGLMHKGCDRAGNR